MIQETNKFKVWCDFHKGWEVHNVAMCPDGSLMHIGQNTMSCANPNTHHVLMCVGSRDRNNTLVYQDDLVKVRIPAGYSECYKDYILRVVWSDYSNGYVLKDKCNFTLGSDRFWFAESEVVGSFYESPELLSELD